MKLWDGMPPHQSADTEFEPELHIRAVEGAELGIVICPGGAYMELAEHEGAAYAAWLNSVGVSAAVLDYRVAPCRAPAQMADVQRAIRLARHALAQHGVRKLGVMGSSAGGHLAAAASVHYDRTFYPPQDAQDAASARPDFTVLCYPVIDLRVPSATRPSRLGAAPDSQLQAIYSPHLHVTADTPPAFLWHTAADEGVSAENSLMYAAALVRNGVSCELHMYPKGHHGLGLAQNHPYVSRWTQELCRWLQAFCAGQTAPPVVRGY